MKTILAVAVAFSCLLSFAGNMAEARGSRGPSAAQIKAAQAKVKAQQEAQQAYQAAYDKRTKEIFNRYDLDKNGKLDSTEKPSFDRYWREVKLGKADDPYANLKVETPKTTTTAKKK